MDQLILTINDLQSIINKYNISGIPLPQIVVVGSQSSGKSSVLERIIGYDILPKAAKVATRCPIILQLVNRIIQGSERLMGVFEDGITKYHGAEEIGDQLRKRNNAVNTLDEGVTEKPIILRLYSETLPTLTLIDLPGIIRLDGEVPAGSKDKIIKLNQDYASQRNSIILAISAANVDLSNSDAISISKDHDPEGKRTLNVITKIDIMDKGTSVTDMLAHVLLMKSLGTICVVNRNQDSVTKKKSIKETNDEEIEYLSNRLKEIPGDHGVEVLINKLVSRLDEEIKRNIPEIEDVITHRIEFLSFELKGEDTADKSLTLHRIITKFINEYKKMVRGKKENYRDELIGGAKIRYTIYINFENSISKCEISKKTKDQMVTLLKNTTGTRKMLLSFEEAFLKLIRKEIDQFESPSLECNDEVRNLLKEFVGEIIKELHLDKYATLPSIIEDDMVEFITKKHQYTEEIIKNIIRCEKEDLYYFRPDKKQFNIHEQMSSINKLINDGNCVLPLQLKMILYAASYTGCLDTLIKAVSGIIGGTNLEAYPQAPDTLRVEESEDEVEVPPGLMRILNDSGYGENATEIYELISQQGTNYFGIINSTIDMFQSKEVDEETQQDVLDIEQMIEKHFKKIRKHMKCNVSKWIQTVFIKDLLDEMDDALYSIQQGNAEELLSINPIEEQKIKEHQEQLKDLKSVAENLLKIRRSRIIAKC